MDHSKDVMRYLTASGRFAGPLAVEFLAAGEYNENYLVAADGSRYVFRINHGSQLGLANQIEYEFKVLQAVVDSGVTPQPFFCDPRPDGLLGGVLVMAYLPGGPLDYGRDLDQAAEVFARIHALPTAEGLIIQRRPVADIAAESRELFSRQSDHPLRDVRRRLEAYHDRVLRLFEDTRRMMDEEPMVIVNTEVNSGNFLVDDRGTYLVDWEKAVVSQRYQDLGHFLVPTTTLWKTDTVLTEAQKRRFLKTYRMELETLNGSYLPTMEELETKTDILERTILLRALAWCYMAFYEYTRTDRPLKNPDTFAKIRQYLEQSECFLK